MNDAGFDKRRTAAVEEHVQDLIDDDAFWKVQAHSLAILVTPDHIDTFRLANVLLPRVEVSDRFHLKPLMRAVTFPNVAFVLALSENAARLVEVTAEGAPLELPVPGMPKGAADAVRQSSISDRSPSGRIIGSEGKKVRLTQYARQVDTVLRPVLAGSHAPLFLAAPEPLLSIFRSVSSSATLSGDTIAGNADRLSDAERTTRPPAGLLSPMPRRAARTT